MAHHGILDVCVSIGLSDCAQAGTWGYSISAVKDEFVNAYKTIEPVLGYPLTREFLTPLGLSPNAARNWRLKCEMSL